MMLGLWVFVGCGLFEPKLEVCPGAPGLGCENPERILDVAGSPSGYVRCADGSVNRVAAQVIEPAYTDRCEDRPGSADPNLSCEVSADCGADGYCRFGYWEPGPGSGCYCVSEPCREDGDCENGLCYLGACVEAECRNASDCESGECGLWEVHDRGSDLELTYDGIVCRTAGDDCRHGDADPCRCGHGFDCEICDTGG